jgi:5-methylcytosine-specific restriction endonuclease McrBC regulatory subunit McrC
VPAWVLSSMILVRLQVLLDSLTRRFESTTALRTAPRGRIDWSDYAQKQLPRGQFVSVPCTYPDLRDDRALKGAICFALERQLRALQGQVESGAFVHRLIELCEHLLMKVRGIAPVMPPPGTFQQWMQRPMRSTQFLDGLQAIEWTANERGLAGISDLEGIPWTMPMDEFFEAFTETVMQSVARRIGAQLKVGRRHETTQPIIWSPPFVGSQRSLIPDLWLDWQDTTLIVDAKYKRHWQEMQQRSWASVEDEIREQHRNDLFQVLAYANLARTQRVIACLLFPCAADLWKDLRQTDRLIHKAEVQAGPRSLHLWLTAIPMGIPPDEIALPIEHALRNAVFAEHLAS